MLRFFLRQFFRSKSCLFAVGLLYAFLLAHAWEDLHTGADALLLFQVTSELGVAVMLRPIAAALPIAFFLMRETGTRYHSFVLCRSSCGAYAVSKAAAAYVIGFAVPLAACALLLATAAVVSPASLAGLADTGVRLFPHLLARGLPFLALVLYLIAWALPGAIWAAAVVGLSALTTNGYVLVAAPFLLERVLSDLLQFFSRNAPTLLLFDTTQGYACTRPGGLAAQAIYSVLLTAAAALLVYCTTKRRLHHG